MELKMLKKFYYWLHKKFSKPEEAHEYSRGYWQNKVRSMAIELCQRRKGRLLEVGCGEGLFLTELALANKDLEIYGIDNWQEMLQKTDRRLKEKNIKNVRLSLADAASLPFEDSYFDAVYCINVIFNLKSVDVVEKAINEMARVCKSGGKIIFDIRNSANPLLYLKYKLAPLYDETVKDLPLKTYNERDMQYILNRNGLDTLRKLYIGSPIKKIAPIIILEAVKQ